jgi:hypothetical protein
MERKTSKLVDPEEVIEKKKSILEVDEEGRGSEHRLRLEGLPAHDKTQRRLKVCCFCYAKFGLIERKRYRIAIYNLSELEVCPNCAFCLPPYSLSRRRNCRNSSVCADWLFTDEGRTRLVIAMQLLTGIPKVIAFRQPVSSVHHLVHLYIGDQQLPRCVTHTPLKYFS